jgi:iron-sulfur cluster assembly protein
VNAPISISPKAAGEIRQILASKNIPDGYGLRVGVKGAGCSVGFRLGFDTQKDGDECHEVAGIKVLIQKREILFLAGKEIDFYDEADGRGFLFR